MDSREKLHQSKPRHNICTSLKNTLANTTLWMLNTLSSHYYGNTKPCPHLPHYKSLTMADMFLSEKAFDGTVFAKEMATLTEMALKSDYHKATMSIGGATAILILDPKDLEEILEEKKDCLDSKESIPLFEHYFEGAPMVRRTDDPLWRPARNQITTTVDQMKKNPKKIIDIAKKHVKDLAESKASEINLMELVHSFTMEVLLSAFTDI